MNSETVNYLLVGVLFLTAVAVLLQAVFLMVLGRAAKDMRDRQAAFLEKTGPKIEELIELIQSGRKTMEENGQQLRQAVAKLHDILDLTRVQIERVDEVMSDATGRAKAQLERVELVLDDTITRFHQVAVTLNDTVLRPVRKVSGLFAGVHAALSALGHRRTPVDRATADEEMFI